MAAPDPDSLGLLEKLLGGLALVGTAVVAPIWAARNWLDKRFATKHALRDAMLPLATEQAIQRQHIAKVFDQIRENEQRAQDRHERVLELLTRKD
jgi:hypothetical protein